MSDIPAGFERVPCPGCGGEKHVLTYTGAAIPDAPGSHFQIVRCEDCGLHFTNPRPLIGELGKYYPDDYPPYRGEEEGKAIGGWFRSLILRDAFGAPPLRPSTLGHLAARAVTTFRRAQWFGFGVEWRGRGRLLDFGCGAGKFLRRMHALGWDVTGIDFSQTAVDVVRASGLRALQGTLPHPQL